MEAQGVPVTIANLAIHRHREEEMNRERMRHNQTVQEAASQRARETNKGKAREVVPDSEEEESEEMYSSPSEEWEESLDVWNAKASVQNVGLVGLNAHCGVSNVHNCYVTGSTSS
ncbi:hypothetical protein PIB30_054104 [Stylosanthes scabra]|uniref:Uncharacterized protein n=1 Tax=Stylosanthes scabra TaxID=79078 RepID=A0ABU6SIY2_9FABA|nr:hypothetical protein [Stylosanthes scabra]